MTISDNQNNVTNIAKMMSDVNIQRKDDKDFNPDDPDFHPSDGNYNSNSPNNDESILDSWPQKRKRKTRACRSPDRSTKRTRRNPGRSLDARGKSLEETNDIYPDFESSDDELSEYEYEPSEYEYDQLLEQCHLSSPKRSPDRSMKTTRRNPGRSLDARGKSLDETNNYNPGFQSSDNQHSDYEYNRRFEQCYICSPLSAIDKEHLEDGNRIIMPQSALESLVNLNIDYPMMFEIKKHGYERRVSHCGVLEFTAEEGFVCLPNWMMKNLDLQEGDIVTMKNARLPKGASMKIQPHLTAFINLPDAKEILEEGLKNYSCVTTGDTIVIPHNLARFFIDIVETKPTKAISVVETDCVVDFAPPLDYKEPEKKPKEELIQEKDLKLNKQDKEKAPFQPFSGRKNRLDGIVEEPDSSLLVDNMSTRAPKEPNLMNAQQKSLPKKFNVCPCEPSKTSSSSGKNVELNSETEEKGFKAFTGKKYTLRG